MKPKSNLNPKPKLNLKPLHYNTLVFHCALAFALCGVSCQRGGTPPSGSSLSVTTTAPSKSSAAAANGWLARLTGFDDQLATQSAELEAASAAVKRAELEASAVRVQLDAQRESTHEARQGLSFWRIAASAAGALSLVAVFVGAALGSQARRHRPATLAPDADACATAA